MAEIWKTISVNTKYEISNMGRVRHAETLYVSKPKLHANGKYCITFKEKGGFIGRLVLTAFVRPPIDKGEFCGYKNGNRLDDRLENLEWTRENKGSGKARGTVVACPPPSPESVIKIFTLGNGRDIEVSDQGIVKTSQGWTLGSINGTKGYRRIDFGAFTHNVHKIVAMCFIGEPPKYVSNEGNLVEMIVDHINGDKYDNRAENLRYVTQSENAINGYATGNSSTETNNKKVDQYALDGTFIKTHVSISDAARKVGLEDGNAIARCCKLAGHTSAGFVWRYHGEDFEQEYKPPAKKPRTEPPPKENKVFAYDKKTLEFFKGWPSALAASKDFAASGTRCETSNISKVLNGKAKQTAGYIFSFLDNEEAFREDRKKRGL